MLACGAKLSHCKHTAFSVSQRQSDIIQLGRYLQSAS